jgi:chondroitin 4-sulfotransferase 11
MPISHDKKIIFIHIPKNAGTSFIISNNMEDNYHHFPQYYINKYPDEWMKYRKIAIIRNTWDRVVSCYEYAKMENSFYHGKNNKSGNGIHPDYETLKNKTFEECVLLLKEGKLNHQGWHHQNLYTHINNKFILDELIDFNTLKGKMIKLNSSTRKKYQEYYNEGLIELVQNIYKIDIEIFGFKYNKEEL